MSAELRARITHAAGRVLDPIQPLTPAEKHEVYDLLIVLKALVKLAETPPKPRPRITTALIDQARELLELGYSQGEIATRLGIHRSTVANHLHKIRGPK